MKRLILIFFTGLLFLSCQFNCESVKFSVSEVKVLQEPDGVYYSGYWPDGKLCLVQKDDAYQMFWGEAVDVLTSSESTWPENHYSQLLEKNVVFGKGKSSIEDFNEDGSWFIGVFPLDDSGNYAGFFHAESHWSPDTDGTAYKSIGVAYSADYGKTWDNVSPILKDEELKPSNPEWSGLGDGTVIYDEKNSRWICYYQGRVWNFLHLGSSNKICMAVSYDEKGGSGTWKKWNGGKFLNTGLNLQSGKGGENGAVKALEKVPGANPSVIWSEDLNKWIMAYASWDKEIYISFSSNGTVWSKPVKALGSKEHPVWYPNLISEKGDKTASGELRMYFSYDQNVNGNSYGKRQLAYVTLNF